MRKYKNIWLYIVPVLSEKQSHTRDCIGYKIDCDKHITSDCTTEMNFSSTLKTKQN
jgi:hypothetical protein